MEFSHIIGTTSYGWIIIPFLIFLARIVDVTLGTMRIIYVSRELKWLATLTGFFEVLVWLIAITQIMKNLSSVEMYLGYAAGFAVGNYVGIMIEQRVAVGTVLIRVITNKDAKALFQRLGEMDVVVTSTAARSVKDVVRLIFVIAKRKEIDTVIDTIYEYNPNAFITIEDVTKVRDSIYSTETDREFASLRTVRKIK